MQILIGSIALLIIAIILFSIDDYFGDKGSTLFAVLLGAGITIFVNFINNNRQDSRSELDRKNAILLASLEKRLEIHQQAYTLTRRLARSAHSPPAERLLTLPTLTQECGEWWDKNALYLTQDAKDNFQLLIFNIESLNFGATSHDDRMNVYDLIGTTARSIKEGVQLYLSEQEYDELTENEQ